MMETSFGSRVSTGTLENTNAVGVIKSAILLAQIYGITNHPRWIISRLVNLAEAVAATQAPPFLPTAHHVTVCISQLGHVQFGEFIPGSSLSPPSRTT
jgi:hypothetical protein